MTTLIVRVRNRAGALYEALGGFARNGVNITRLESYTVDGSFRLAQFWIDAEGHSDEELMKLALRELDAVAEEVEILGVYPASAARDALTL